MQDGAALLAGAPQYARLPGDQGLRLRTGHEVPQARNEVDRLQAGRVDDRDARVVARLLEQQSAVLGRDPTRRPDAEPVRPGRDVRDVESVTHDAHALARRGVGLPGAVGTQSVERLRLEVGADVGVRDLVEQRRQCVVHQRLAVGARGRRDGAELAGGDDVPRGDRGILRGDRRGGDGERQDGDQDERTAHGTTSRRGGDSHDNLATRPVGFVA